MLKTSYRPDLRAVKILTGTTALLLLGWTSPTEAACPGPIDLKVGYDFDFGAKTGIAPPSMGACVAEATTAPAGDDNCSANTTDATNGDYVIRTADFGVATLKYSFPVGAVQENYTMTVDIPLVGDAGYTAGATARPAGESVAKWVDLPSYCSETGSEITNNGHRLICNVGTVDATAGPIVIAVPASFKVSPSAYNGETFSLNFVESSSGGTGGACSGEATQTSQALTVSARPNIDMRTQIYRYAPTTRSGVPGFLMAFYLFIDSATVGANVGGERIVNPLDFEVGLKANVATPGIEFVRMIDSWVNTTKMVTTTPPGTIVGNGTTITVSVIPDPNPTNVLGESVPCDEEFLVPGGGCIYNDVSPQRISTHAIEYFVPLSAFGANGQIDFESFLNSDGSNMVGVVSTPAASGGAFDDPIIHNSGNYTAVQGLGGTFRTYMDRYAYRNGLERPDTTSTANIVRMPGEAGNWCNGGECKQFPTRTVETLTIVRNRGTASWTNTILCDKFDNRGMVLTPTPRQVGIANHRFPDNMQVDPIVGLYQNMTASTMPNGYTVEVATAAGTPAGGGYPSDTQECGDADATWVDAGTVTDFTDYNLVRLKIPTVASVFTPGVSDYFAPVFRYTVPVSAPDGELIGHQVILKTDTENFGGGIGEFSTATFDPATNSGVTRGQRFQVVKALVRVQKTAFHPTFGTETAIVGAGKDVTFELAPTYSADIGLTAPVASMDVIDVLPAPLTYVLGSGHTCNGGSNDGGLCTGGTSVPLEPDSITVDANGDQVLTWTLNGLVLGDAIAPIYFKAAAPLTTPLGTVLTNNVTVSSPMVDQSSDDERSASAAVTIDSIAGFFTTKGTNVPTISKDGAYTNTLQVANLKATEEADVDLIDYFPYSGDPRSPASDFKGTLVLTGAVTADAALTIYYTNAAVGAAPTALISTVGGTSGSAYAADFAIAPTAANGWCEESEFGTGSCPGSFADVTGVRATYAIIPGTATAPDNVVNLVIPFQTDGNSEEDTYTNRFILNSFALMEPLISNDAVTIVRTPGVIPVNLDADDDGIPDAIEGGDETDTDGDGVPDYLDLDSDNDGILDIIEGQSGCVDTMPNDGMCDGPDANDDGLADDAVNDAPDTDGDGTPDFLDLDSDNDGITDLAEGQSGCLDTTPADAVCDGPDTDMDGIADDIDDAVGAGTTPTPEEDFDVDGVPDYLDLDSDNDGILDIIEGASSCADMNMNGVCDGPDSDGDGIADSIDTTDGHGDEMPTIAPNTDGTDGPDYIDLDSDDDGTPDLGTSGCVDTTPEDDVCDGGDSDGDGIVDPQDPSDSFGTALDTDMDGISDTDDLDDDNDGILDADEGTDDTDGDGVMDSLDLDSDNDGILDVVEGQSGCIDASPLDGRCDGDDSDNDGVVDTATESAPDTDGDGIEDFQDLDSDNDGISDLIEGGSGCVDSAPANAVCDADDGDGDGVVDDIDSTNGPGSAPAPEVDTDGDGVPDYLDLDSDNDGLLDITEGGSGCVDSEPNGVCDGPDTDGDGIQDSIDTTDGFGDETPTDIPDADGTGGPDFQDTDSNDDGTPDAAATNCAETNTDGVCDGSDSDGDGIIDSVDGLDGFGASPRDDNGGLLPNPGSGDILVVGGPGCSSNGSGSASGASLLLMLLGLLVVRRRENNDAT